MSEKRTAEDRRRFDWRTVLYGFLRSRRRQLRRNADADVIFIDWHHPWLFFLAVGTMLLSCTDAFLTVVLLDLGMVEANPVMASLLGQGTALFAATEQRRLGVLVLQRIAHYKEACRACSALRLLGGQGQA